MLVSGLLLHSSKTCELFSASAVLILVKIVVVLIIVIFVNELVEVQHLSSLAHKLLLTAVGLGFIEFFDGPCFLLLP